MKIAILFLSAFVLAVNCYPQQRQAAGCNSFCPMYIIQFCGSDGQTYNSNECFIKSQMCNKGLDAFESFSTLHLGACTVDEQKDATTTVSM